MSEPSRPPSIPSWASALLLTADGTIFWGRGAGAVGTRVGEICFNTSITGYQEILTDPSYAGQIITFTFPHIGIVGANSEDVESRAPVACGCVMGADLTAPSNWRSAEALDSWLKRFGLPAITGVDTRRLTSKLRDGGVGAAVIDHFGEDRPTILRLEKMLRDWPGMEGMELASKVAAGQPYQWDQTRWEAGPERRRRGYRRQTRAEKRMVVIDYGAKRNILRSLASQRCAVRVIPAGCPAQVILRERPDGVVLSNGPGDPAATAASAVPAIRELLERRVPIFGICLGHQLLALAMGGRTKKMRFGHRGGNHPVKELVTGKVEITSQNHGFVVDEVTLPESLLVTHRSLFDGTIEGIRARDQPAFGVQYHPEASPGPEDSQMLFGRFLEMIEGST